MAILTPEEKTQLPPLVVPFGRSDKPNDAKVLKAGESEFEEFSHVIHTAEFDGEPENVIYVSEEEIENKLKVSGRFEEKCYLWVIDDSMIRIVREKTRNIKRTYDSEYVCHTNLTGGKLARIGGEMFFANDGRVFINPFSDRYGGVKNISNKQWEATKKYFKDVGYKNLIDILGLLEIELKG